MTETLLDRPTAAHAEDAASRRHAAGGTRDRRLLAALGAVVVVAVAGGGYLLLHGGSPSPAPAAAAHRASAAAAPSTAPSATPSTVPPSYDGTVGRDPFKPLVVPPAPSAAPTAVPVPGASGLPLPVGAVGAGQPAPAVQPDWVELAAQNGTKAATFQVHFTDGKVVTYPNVPAPPAGASTPFGSYFALLSLQDGLAVVQVGDGTPFNLPLGDAGRQSL